MPDPLTLPAIEQSLADALAPLRAHRDRIDEAIEATRAQLAQQLAARNRIDKVIRAADPTEPRPGPKSKPNRQPREAEDWRVSQDKLDRLADWLRENMNGEGFTGTGLAKRDDFDLFSGQSTTAKALRALAARGVIRLDSISGTGGAKVYRLVERG